MFIIFNHGYFRYELIAKTEWFFVSFLMWLTNGDTILNLYMCFINSNCKLTSFDNEQDKYTKDQNIFKIGWIAIDKFSYIYEEILVNKKR